MEVGGAGDIAFGKGNLGLGEAEADIAHHSYWPVHFRQLGLE
eukprot:CAMPEP_0184663764 /NCGR_PEP_ID=MMETSP0308-20130426/49641_1 /TAXON_ID=38269 /ORGANISM="Gloeochaete witrockiana, Strain SAG 46.84" /LENGTH=41 /DNA_ID= /DNA_START= /DNA_END= /DNA_ORIENTATION=